MTNSNMERDKVEEIRTCSLCGEPVEGHGYWNACQTPERQVARLTTQLSQALRELGDARDKLSCANAEIEWHASERDAALRSNAELRGALEWAVPLAKLAMESHRQERLRCGHTFGSKQVGLYDDEVEKIAAVETVLRTALASSSTKETPDAGHKPANG